MHRCLLLLSIANIAIGFGYGCSGSSQPSAEELAARIAVTQVSAPLPPGPKLVQGIAKVSNTAEDQISFTLVLPPNWKWTNGQAERGIGPECTATVSLTARLLPDDERAEHASVAARRRLLELGDEKKSDEVAGNEKLTIRDRRITQVGNSDAAWDVVTFQLDGEPLPTRLQTRCYLKVGDNEMMIEGSYVDSRADRVAVHFDEAQAEFLKIAQSFRVDVATASPNP